MTVGTTDTPARAMVREYGAEQAVRRTAWPLLSIAAIGLAILAATRVRRRPGPARNEAMRNTRRPRAV